MASISEGRESFSKHLSLMVRDDSRILFWHNKWIGDNSLKTLYPQLFVCSAIKIGKASCRERVCAIV